MLVDMTAPADPSLLHAFIASARRATLATVGPGGRPRLVPICFVVDEEGATGGALTLWSAIDDKPKRSADPMRLGRVRDVLARPTATVLIDRWDEEWSRLAWARLDCEAEILPADGEAGGARARPANARARAIAAFRAKYPQYGAQDLEQRPLIRLTCSVAASWGAIEEER
jgi:PPOX class probable F420-dependent enzyme